MKVYWKSGTESTFLTNLLSADCKGGGEVGVFGAAQITEIGYSRHIAPADRRLSPAAILSEQVAVVHTVGVFIQSAHANNEVPVPCHTNVLTNFIMSLYTSVSVRPLDLLFVLEEGRETWRDNLQHVSISRELESQSHHSVRGPIIARWGVYNHKCYSTVEINCVTANT